MKTQKTKYKNKAWELLSKLKRLEEPVCQVCRQRPAVHTHHVIAKSRGLYLYFNKDNLISICFHCHRSWHDGKISPAEIKDIIKREVGKKFEEVETNKWLSIKYTVNDYKEMIQEYKNKIKELEWK